MAYKRIIPCLDVKDSKVVKGINFEGLKSSLHSIEYVDVSAQLPEKLSRTNLIFEQSISEFVQGDGTEPPSMLGDKKIFKVIPVKTLTVTIESINGKLVLVSNTDRRGDPAHKTNPKRKRRTFEIPHLPKAGTILPDELNVQAFGDDSSQGSEQAKVINDKLQGLKNDIEASEFKTIESLYKACLKINKAFKKVNLAEFDCKIHRTELRYCNEVSKVSHCFDVANSLDTLLREQKVI